MEPFVPIVDLGRWYRGDTATRSALARDVDVALATSGFLLVRSHGVDEVLRLDLRAAANEFFALPYDVKDQYAAGPSARGFVPVGREANAYSIGETSPPDLKQSLLFSNDFVPVGSESHVDLFPPNAWPDEMPELAGLVRAWSTEMLRLAGDLTELFAVALGLDPSWLRSRTDRPLWKLGLNCYPPVSIVGKPQPGQFRVGPHTDFGVLTILDREVGMGGLQVQRRDGSWVNAPFVPGALTINLGDLMARWTGDRWRSARHRVLPPPGGTGPYNAVEETLLSLVFFDKGNLDEVVETLPPPVGGPTAYEPIRAADYLRLKLEQISV